MFVKKIPKWKIKRFLKRIIKAIIFFALFFSLNIVSLGAQSKNTYTFPDFETFVGSDGFVSYLCRNSSSSIVKTGDLTAADHNLNDMTFSYNYSSSFTSVRMTVNDSPNVNRSFNANDTIVLRHGIMVHLNSAQVSDTYHDDFAILVNYQKDDFTLGSMEFKGDDALKSSSYANYSWGSVVLFDVDFVAQLPSFSGTITSISYHFYNISAETYSFRVYPSAPDGHTAAGTIYYYVGSSSDAPLYGPPDTTVKDKLVNDEDAIYDSAGVDNSKSFLTDFFDGDGVGYILGGLIGATTVFNIFLILFHF